jgi:ribosome-interacting GTPase 1
MGLLEKIKDIEHEIARTQKNKATEYHLGLLKAKLAKFRTELMDGNKGGGGKGEGFDVLKVHTRSIVAATISTTANRFMRQETCVLWSDTITL